MYPDDKTTADLTAEQLLEISQKVRCHFNDRIPAAVPELVILPVDPWHLHAFWNLPDQCHAGAIAENTDELVLRFYWSQRQSAHQDDAQCFFNVLANAERSQQNVRVPVDNRCYVGVIGLLDEDQNLIVLARSNSIDIPGAMLYPVMEQLKVTKKIEQLTGTQALKKVPQSNQQTNEQYFDEALIHRDIMARLSEQDLTHQFDPVLAVDHSVDNMKGISNQEDFNETQIDQLIRQKLNRSKVELQLKASISIRQPGSVANHHLSGQHYQ